MFRVGLISVEENELPFLRCSSNETPSPQRKDACRHLHMCEWPLPHGRVWVGGECADVWVSFVVRGDDILTNFSMLK